MSFDFEISSISLTEKGVVGSGNDGVNLNDSRVRVGYVCSRCEIGDFGYHIFLYHMTSLLTLWHVYVTSYTTSVSTILLIEVILMLKAISPLPLERFL